MQQPHHRSKRRKADVGRQDLIFQALQEAPKSQAQNTGSKIGISSPFSDGAQIQANSQPSQPTPRKDTKGPEDLPHQSKLKSRAQRLWLSRKTLPVWEHSQRIRQGLRDRDLMLLLGETGSGKSTQVPQMLFQEAWCKHCNVRLPQSNRFIKVGGSIAITEPRRVAAVSLAKRVAEEMGTPLGSSSPASKVGYSVRFDNSTSASTRIKFLTEGMLLQEMLRDPWLCQYSAVIVDEVHERGINVDLVLGFLRKMTLDKYKGRGGIPLKVVIMSATADMARLKMFFERDQSGEADLGMSPSSNNFADEVVQPTQTGTSAAGTSDDLSVAYGDRTPHSDGRLSLSTIKVVPQDENSILSDQEFRKLTSKATKQDSLVTDSAASPAGVIADNGASYLLISTCYIEGRQYPVKINYLPEPAADVVDTALRTTLKLHYKEPLPGDILIFLTGQETVETLESLIKACAVDIGPEVPKLLVLPLFAALPQSAQQQVFQPTPPKTRKIIIATNIAETSVTVSGVRYVIDCGKAKIKQFRARIGLDSLLVKPISKSAAIQRKGRAGREGPGQCYRLYTEQNYLEFKQSNTPEILRCDLSHAILTMKARGVNDVVNFPFLDRPPREAMGKAMLQLYRLNALNDDGNISEIGLHMAKLPLTVPLGRALVAAAEPDFDCVSEVIDIISCLSVENVFLNPSSDERKQECETARRNLLQREGDHLSLLAIVKAYALPGIDRREWAEKHFVSHRAMRSVMDSRKQLQRHCQQAGTLKLDMEAGSFSIEADKKRSILRCFLKGFAANTARLCPEGIYKTLIGNQTVAIHPSSCLYGKKVEAIMYNEYVFTSKTYARGVSAVQLDWVEEAFGV